MASSSDPLASADPRPGVLFQLLLWTRIGVESFGGGQATRLRIYHEFVERRGWMTSLDFGRAWGVCQLSPGINLIALSALLGRRISGVAGVITAMVGLLLPSAVITVLMTIVYLRLQDLAVVRAAVHGVVAAVLGIAFVNVFLIAKPLLAKSLSEGRASLVVGLLLMAAAAVLTALNVQPVAVLLVGGGAVSAIWTVVRRRP